MEAKGTKRELSRSKQPPPTHTYHSHRKDVPQIVRKRLDDLRASHRRGKNVPSFLKTLCPLSHEVVSALERNSALLRVICHLTMPKLLSQVSPVPKKITQEALRHTGKMTATENLAAEQSRKECGGGNRLRRRL